MHALIVKLRSCLLVYLTHRLALPLLKLVRKPEKFPYTREDLFQMPEGSLGKDLVTMLDKKNLKLLPYYARHDIKHILLQYDTTDEGEVCLQCFMLGNKHLSFPVVATVLFGMLTMPECWSRLWAAYRRGAGCTSIEDWEWVALLPLPTSSLIEKINQPHGRRSGVR